MGRLWGVAVAVTRWGGGGGKPGHGGGPRVWGGRMWGRGAEAVPAILARGRWLFPKPKRPVLGGRGIPRAGVWHWGVRTPETVSKPPKGRCPGPVVWGFAPGTQPMGRAGECTSHHTLLWYSTAQQIMLQHNETGSDRTGQDTTQHNTTTQAALF